MRLILENLKHSLTSVLDLKFDAKFKLKAKAGVEMHLLFIIKMHEKLPPNS